MDNFASKTQMQERQTRTDEKWTNWVLSSIDTCWRQMQSIYRGEIYAAFMTPNGTCSQLCRHGAELQTRFGYRLNQEAGAFTHHVCSCQQNCSTVSHSQPPVEFTVQWLMLWKVTPCSFYAQKKPNLISNLISVNLEYVNHTLFSRRDPCPRLI